MLVPLSIEYAFERAQTSGNLGAGLRVVDLLANVVSLGWNIVRRHGRLAGFGLFQGEL